MGTEIERKFLLKDDGWRHFAEAVKCRQGYLNSARERTVRVRTMEDRGFLTVKGIAMGAVRPEYEYEIPEEDAAAMLNDLCEKPIIEKNRYKIEYGNLTWEVDEFLGENRGLIVAEVELAREDQQFQKPDWIGAEVTGDPKYFNSNLATRPFVMW